MYRKVTFKDAKNIIDNYPSCLILDVREEYEYITGHADGALLFPLDSINSNTAADIIPSKTTPLLIYCRTGSRSIEAAHKLMLLGYSEIYDIGSLVGWPYGISWE